MPLSDVFAAARWWLVLLLIGLAALPLTTFFLGRLPDRGYAFVKMVGLLIVSYVFWLLGTLGFLANNLGGILLAVAVLVAISLWTERRSGGASRRWLGENWRYVLLVEGVFLVIFGLWVWARAQNPNILDTEKYMEFAFLNSVGRTPNFPPLDPWLSGFAISYYYFGYVMVSIIARLAFVTEAIAFNLGIAWLTAGTAVAAFGLVYNLLQADRPVPETPPAPDEAPARSARRSRWALYLGFLAAVALPLAGNLEIGLEVMHANGIGSESFWRWLDVQDLNSAPNPNQTPRYETAQWWWWRSSRVISEYQLSGRAELGLSPIAEFPGFSFALGDMHPHVLALPFAFLSLAIAFAWWRRPGQPLPLEPGPSRLADWWREGKGIIQYLTPAEWGLTALFLGGLSFLNTWDVLIHLFVIVGAFSLGQWRERGSWDGRLTRQMILVALLLVIPAVLLYFPFYLSFSSQAGPPFLLPFFMRPTRLAHFLIIFGMPLLVLIPFLLTLLVKVRRRRQAVKTGFLAVGFLITILTLLMFLLGWIIASSQDGSVRVLGLLNELGISPSAYPQGDAAGQVGWGFAAVLQLAPALLRARLELPGVTLLLGGSLALAVMGLVARLNRPVVASGTYATLPDVTLPGVTLPDVSVPDAPGPDESALITPGAAVFGQTEAEPSAQKPAPAPKKGSSALPFVLLLILTGTLLTLGPEFVYLKDNFNFRLNTIFKFYYQAWVLFGVAAIYGLDFMRRRFRPVGIGLMAIYHALLLVTLLFPIFAIPSRAAFYRGPADSATRKPPTLDGMNHMLIDQPDEYAAITWLRQETTGMPVIVEAVGPDGGQYSREYGRISAHTGLPTLLGWIGHEYQWRGSTVEPAVRADVVRQIFDQPQWSDELTSLLNRYDVGYIYVGPVERNLYRSEGVAKFAANLEVAYVNNSVTIYRWRATGARVNE